MNFTDETYEEAHIPGVGVRIDYNLTPRDAIEGVFMEITAAANASTAAPTAFGGTLQVDTLTFPDKATAGDGDYFIITDTNLDEWAVAFDLTGASAEPTGARWLAVPVAQRAQCDISATVTAADVAAAVELVFDALAGVIVVTDDSAADGTMTFTQAARAVVVNPETFNTDDTGAGTITTAPTTPGVASAVDPVADTITMASDPGWATGKKVVLTTTGGAPTGLVSGNTYYVISLGAGIYQFASSLANALAGTEIDITDEGDAGSTLTLTTAASTIGYLFNSMHKLTDAQINLAITADGFYDVNLADNDSYMIAQLGFDFSVQTKNRLFIKPAETFDGFTIPDQLLPHLTLRIDDPTIKISDIKISRRGVN